MAVLRTPARLAEQKQALIRRCELDRDIVAGSLDDLERRTSWVELGIAAAGFLAPKAKLLIPIVGFLLPRLLPHVLNILPGLRRPAELPHAAPVARSGWRTAATIGFSVAKKLFLLSRGLRLLPRLLAK